MFFPPKCEHLLFFTHHVAAEDEDRKLQTYASFLCYSGTGRALDRQSRCVIRGWGCARAGGRGEHFF